MKLLQNFLALLLLLTSLASAANLPNDAVELAMEPVESESSVVRSAQAAVAWAREVEFLQPSNHSRLVGIDFFSTGFAALIIYFINGALQFCLPVDGGSLSYNLMGNLVLALLSLSLLLDTSFGVGLLLHSSYRIGQGLGFFMVLPVSIKAFILSTCMALAWHQVCPGQETRTHLAGLSNLAFVLTTVVLRINAMQFD